MKNLICDLAWYSCSL